jgi:hypothetical protein
MSHEWGSLDFDPWQLLFGKFDLTISFFDSSLDLTNGGASRIFLEAFSIWSQFGER